METDVHTAAIAANISALARLLTDAAILAEEGVEAMAQGSRNQAIGTILPLEQSLNAATALFGAALALHRQSAPELRDQQPRKTTRCG